MNLERQHGHTADFTLPRSPPAALPHSDNAHASLARSGRKDRRSLQRRNQSQGATRSTAGMLRHRSQKRSQLRHEPRQQQRRSADLLLLRTKVPPRRADRQERARNRRFSLACRTGKPRRFWDWRRISRDTVTAQDRACRISTCGLPNSQTSFST